MAEKIDQTLGGDLRGCLEKAFADPETERALTKAVRDVTDRVQSNVEWALKDELAPMLAGWVEGLAASAVEQLLAGNEDQMRRYLGCEKRGEDGAYIGWTGRYDAPYWGRKREPEEWHPVIHGRLFEQGAVALRKQIVDAHRDLLVNERILDLESQVQSLVAQNNKLERERDEARERYRSVA